MVSARLLKVAAASALALSAPAFAVDEGFAARAQALIDKAYPDTGPGAAVIVTEGGKVVFAGGSGKADIAAGTDITPETVFRLGSITKQFAAAALLQLVAEGKLSLDDKVSQFVPGYPEPGASATVRQLLNHTSGIQSYTGIPGWMVEAKTNRPYTTAELIAEFRDQPAAFQPGEKWDYNNSGYVLVGAVIEAVADKPWHEVVRERLASPLGLATIRYGGEESRTPGFAVGYTGGEGAKFTPAQKIHMSVPHAAGALIGTVGDLARWTQALHAGKVVPAPLYAEMIAPTALPDGKSEPYGYGIGQGDVRGVKAIGHGGGIFGFSTDSIYLPEKDLFVAVFTNADSGIASAGLTMNRLAAEAIGKPYPVFTETPFEAATLEPALGLYRIDGGDTTRSFFLREGQLYTQRSGASESRVYHAGDNRFFYGPDSLNWFELVREPSGTYAMMMHQNGADKAERAVRTGPVPAAATASFAVPRDVLDTYAGNYTSAFAPIVVAVRDDAVLTLKLGGQPPVPLRATGEREFAAVGVDARVVFEQADGKVSGLVIHQGGGQLPATRDAPPTD
ncbi:serine hydrolase domain-containing protein [Tsuneonella troitsensis]|uniref:serine hydrolase domain-containing protein n=1 Tax=Tsuneonella troitsensis TaxID=292222 RepID=UPI000AE5DEFD|nr:serine hydrolase domain-containing protein [Tsuneonella troitsensis]